jgi:hypothetical protein
MQGCSEVKTGKGYHVGFKKWRDVEVKVLFFFHTKDLTGDVLEGLSALVEKIFVEDNPKATTFYNIKSTPFTIVEDKRFPGIATAEQILKVKSQRFETDLSSQIRPGTMTLVSGTNLSKLLIIIKDLKKNGKDILYITKTYPEALARKYGLDQDYMVWLLPTAVNETSVSMTDLPKLSQIINEFLDKHEGGIIVMEGLEALANYNPLPSVTDMTKNIKKKVSQKKATAYFLFLPNAMSEEAALEIRNIFTD